MDEIKNLEKARIETK